jgi:predicted DNA-binding protein
MNILFEKNDSHINAKVPREMKELIVQISRHLNMNESQYIKLAIKERIEKDLKNK